MVGEFGELRTRSHHIPFPVDEFVDNGAMGARPWTKFRDVFFRAHRCGSDAIVERGSEHLWRRLRDQNVDRFDEVVPFFSNAFHHTHAQLKGRHGNSGGSNAGERTARCGGFALAAIMAADAVVANHHRCTHPQVLVVGHSQGVARQQRTDVFAVCGSGVRHLAVGIADGRGEIFHIFSR